MAFVRIETRRCDEPPFIYVVDCKDRRAEGNAQPCRCGFDDEEVVVVEANLRGAPHRRMDGKPGQPSVRLTNFRMAEMAREIFPDRVPADRMEAFVKDFAGYRLDEVLGA